MFAHACKLGLEGVVSKVGGSATPSPTPVWLGPFLIQMDMPARPIKMAPGGTCRGHLSISISNGQIGYWVPIWEKMAMSA